MALIKGRSLRSNCILNRLSIITHTVVLKKTPTRKLMGAHSKTLALTFVYPSTLGKLVRRSVLFRQDNIVTTKILVTLNSTVKYPTK